MDRQPTLQRQPAVWGTPGGSLSDSPELIQAGVAGERKVAAAIEAALPGPEAFIFHDVLGRGEQNVDHVVVYGDLLIVIDAKTWAPGRYEWVDNGRHGVCLRDGEEFAPGALFGVVEAARDLRSRIGWMRHCEVVVAVAPSSGTEDDLDFASYDPPHVNVVKLSELRSVLPALVAHADVTHDAQIELHALHRITYDNEIARSAYGDQPLGPAPDGVAVPRPVAPPNLPRLALPLQVTAVAALVATWAFAPARQAMPSTVWVAVYALVAAVALLDAVRFAVRLRPHQETMAKPLRRFWRAAHLNERFKDGRESERTIESSGLETVLMAFLLVATPAAAAGFVWCFDHFDGARNTMSVWCSAIGLLGFAYAYAFCVFDLCKIRRQLGDDWQGRWDEVFDTIGRMPAWQLPFAGYALRRWPTLASEAYLNAAESAGGRWQRFARAVRGG